MRRRSFAHRVSAIVSSVLLLQLSLAAGGRPCHLTAGHAMDAGAHAAKGQSARSHADGHGQHATPATAATAATASTPRTACDGMALSDSCNAPASTGGCGAATACAAGAGMIAPAADSLDTQPRDAIRIFASPGMPLGPAFAPELPPPRV